MPTLLKLDITATCELVNSNDAQFLGESIGGLIYLEELNLSGLNPRSLLYVMPYLQNLKNLKNLTLFQVFTLFNDGTIDEKEKCFFMLISSLSELTQLEKLDLSALLYNQNYPGSYLDIPTGTIGYASNENVIFLAKILPHLSRLTFIDLGYHHIGFHGPEGPSALLEAFSQMPNLQEINLTGMTNITWTQGADDIQRITDAKLESGCKGEICYGTQLDDQTTTEASKIEEFFDCELDACSDRYAMLEHLDQARKVIMIEEQDSPKAEQTNSESLLKNFLHSPCYFANWCLDQFIKDALDMAHEAVEAGGHGYGLQKSVYELCHEVSMFNNTHIYHPILEIPCPRTALPGR